MKIKLFFHLYKFLKPYCVVHCCFPKCSLMGGVQLFAMIKMLGLQRSDLNPRFDNGAAWCGYQVRIIFEMVDIVKKHK